jgi:AcrR family transcriptional regulator
MATEARAVDDEPGLRPPLQNRSRKSLERILIAGKELLEEKGWEGFTVQEVSRRAKVSIGSIYARAPSKEALIVAVYDRALIDIAADNARLSDDSRWDGLELRDLIIEAVREVIEVALRHQKILTVFMNRSPVDPVIRARASDQIRAVAARWEELMLRHSAAVTHPNPELAIEIAFRMVFATMSRRVQFGPDFAAYQTVSDEQLTDEVGRAVAAYLLEPVPATASS